MISDIIKRLLQVDSKRKIIVFTTNKVCEHTYLRSILERSSFTIYDYKNVEAFRVIYEEQLKHETKKIAVIVSTDIYVPYDIRQAFFEVEISASTLFPNLNADTVMDYMHDWDIISFAAQLSYTDYSLAKQTEQFIFDTVISPENIEQFCQAALCMLETACKDANTYQNWIEIALRKSSLEYYAAMSGISIDLSFLDEAFKAFINDGYSRLSTEVNSTTPVIITRALSMISAEGNDKNALIVMDGMSLFDFKAIQRHFTEIDYCLNCSFALIPTTTPISRQSLLSGKFPRELERPFILTDEEKEFKIKADSMGYLPAQVEFLRGYDAEAGPLTKFVAVIINEIDEIVHGQRQGRIGMYNDMDLLGKSGKLQALISRFVTQGFTVYITSDHGNTLCTGVGGFRSGVEVQSRSKRMAVLKDFAEANALLTENTTKYQGFYLDKGYKYFICNDGVSFDHKGEVVMTHGGMSIDEVIVPFIKIRGSK